MVNAPAANQGSLRRDLFAMGAAALICVSLYFAIASENGVAYRSKPVTYNHFNLLVDGFLSGHLYMNLALDPEKLLPGHNLMRYTHREHDTSLYKGRYYLYFGVAPALILFLPSKVLTGLDLPQYWAGALFVSVGYLFTVGLLGRLKRDFFPWLSPAVLFASTLVLGLVNGWPMLLSRVGIWEVCVSSAYCFSCLALYCVYGAMGRGRSCIWLAAASLCIGLAIGSRPNFLFGAAILLVPLVNLRRAERAGPSGNGPWLARWCAVAVPVACVGALLALYNYERFGDPLELGTKYMVLYRPNPLHPFSFGYAGFNTYMYLLAPAHRSPWFPFFNPSPMPDLPKNYSVEPEDMYGVLSNMPILMAAVFCLWYARLRGEASRPGALVGAAALLLLAVGGPLIVYAGANNRYIPDAMCGLPVLAVLGIWAVEKKFRRGGAPQLAARAALALLAAYSVAFVGCAGIQRDDIFKHIHPGAYRAIAHALDYPSYWYDRVRGATYGPVTLDVTFPRNSVTKNEPLVVTGWGPLSDVLFARYVDPSHLQLGFVGPGGIILSKGFEIDYAKPHRMNISMGSLYPPRESPFWDFLAIEDADILSHTLSVAIDGATRFKFRTEFFDAVERRPELGRGPPSVVDKRWVFTGSMTGG